MATNRSNAASSSNEDDSSTDRGRRGAVRRRRFVKSVGAAGIAAGLAGCSGGGSETDTSSGSDSADGGGGSDDQSGTSTGETETSASEVTVQYVTWPAYVDNADQVNELLREAGLSDRITVEFSNVFNQTDGAQAKYRQWLSSGRETPDLMEFDTGWTQPFVIRDQLANIENGLPDGVVSTVKEEYSQPALRSATGPEGTLFALPHFPDYPHIQYRQDLVQDAGYDPSDWATEAMSWKRFAEVTADVQAQAGTKHGYVWQAPASTQLSCCVFNEFLSSWGGAFFGNPQENLFGPIGDRPVTVDEQPVIDSLKMGRSFVKGPDAAHTLDGYPKISPESVYQWGVIGSNKPFQSGDAVMSRNWPFLLPSLGGEDGFGEDLGTMPIPYGVEAGEGNYPGTGGSIAALGGWNVGVNPNSQYTDEAMEVLAALTDETVMLETFELAGWIPPKPSVLDSERARNVPVLGRYVDTLLFLEEHAMPRPATAAWSTQSGKVAERAQEALKNTPPAEAMSTLKSELEQIENSF
jgi:ABC-type glycerol-3-phosphate transport system substrate-binding protein